MTKVWVVGVSDCEGNSIKAICSTKILAERELFKARDELVEEYKRMKIYTEKSQKEFIDEQAKRGVHVGGFRFNDENMYDGMIKALSSDDYKNWDNYPHDCPYLYESEVIDQ